MLWKLVCQTTPRQFLPNLQFCCRSNNTMNQVPIMPGRSSAVPGDTSKMESPVPLLGAAGQAGSMDPDGIKKELNPAIHSAALAPEGACQPEQYCLLVRIQTARDKKPLQAHVWGGRHCSTTSSGQPLAFHMPL